MAKDKAPEPVNRPAIKVKPDADDFPTTNEPDLIPPAESSKADDKK